MRYIITHIETIIATYPGHPPMALWLKQYYKHHPRLGSRDRRAITAAVYLYYRNAPFYKKESSALSVVLKEVNQNMPVFLQQALQRYQLEDPIPIAESRQTLWPVKLSEAITVASWLTSMRQPAKLFIRIRLELVVALQRLSQEKVPVNQINLPGNNTSFCLSLPNGTAIDKLLPEKSYVVQDASSQKSVALLLHWISELGEPMPEKVWDVCSGAGGKSIFLKDQLRSFDLVASDVRPAILHNLQKRFSLYGLTAFRTLVLDVTREASVEKALRGELFDWVICDVPCSGSGTWARTPEQFYFFDPKNMPAFHLLQTQITANAWQFVRPGGYLAYITCSVFEVENEQIVKGILQHPEATLIHQQLINGINIQADSMFVALVKKRI